MAGIKDKKIKGVHRVTKRLAGGGLRVYYYAFRGGPRFWVADGKAWPQDPAYAIAYAKAIEGAPTGIVHPGQHSTAAVIERYRTSIHFARLAPHTRADYEKYLIAFETEFGLDPIAMFEEKASLAEIREWKDRWAHSPKLYDYATSVVTRLLNWAKDEDACIAMHCHIGVARVYKTDRAGIVWQPEEIEALLAVANEREARIVVAASEGGLTPQDLGALDRKNVQRTPKGRRIFLQRRKTKAPMGIPFTPALARLIDATPMDQEHLVVPLDGHELTPLRASQIVRDLKDRANAAAEVDSSLTHVRDCLRLYDMRGTAATALLRAGCTLNEIAVSMGWGLRQAANIIENYAALVPEVSDEVLRKLEAARARADTDGEAR